MRKYLPLLLISFLVISQKSSAQLDPSFFVNFNVHNKNSVSTLTWTVAYNEGASRFDIERSTNGKDFKTIAILFPTEKFSTENYKYDDTTIVSDKIMYRLRVVNKSQNSFYSKIIVVQSNIELNTDIRILGNPVNDKLLFNYTSASPDQVEINILNMSGNMVFVKKINTSRGSNILNIDLNPTFTPGLYVIQINSAVSQQKAKFIKQ
jgi:hypothetical protein